MSAVLIVANERTYVAGFIALRISANYLQGKLSSVRARLITSCSHVSTEVLSDIDLAFNFHVE